MTHCNHCKKGVLVHTETVIHVVDNLMVAGDVHKCTRCDELTVISRVYQQVKNVRLRIKDVAEAGGL